MSVYVRSADLVSDRKELIDAFLRYLTPESDADRFDWLYLQNPFGAGRAWVAVDGERQEVVGVAAAFPRRVYVRGEPKNAWVLGDFCISPECRSLGPALQLQRACLQEIDSGSLGYAYDFPSTSMMAVYKRIGIEPYGEIVRLAKPLRADRKIAQQVSLQLVVRGLGAVGNLALWLRDRRLRRKNSWVLAIHEGRCGEEFSALARNVSASYGVCIDRSAEYLNWRYLSHPRRPYRILTARRQGALDGYAIFAQEGEDARMVDLFGQDDPEILGRLVAGVVAIARSNGVVTLSAPVLASHRWVELLAKWGFRQRESCPVVVYSRSQFSLPAQAESWFLMEGDRDS